MLSGSEASASTILTNWSPWMLRFTQHDTSRPLSDGMLSET